MGSWPKDENKQQESPLSLKWHFTRRDAHQIMPLEYVTHLALKEASQVKYCLHSVKSEKVVRNLKAIF